MSSACPVYTYDKSCETMELELDLMRMITMLRLTKERERRGWSKAALARSASLDQALMSKIESGRVRPYPTELRRLAEALNWPTGDVARLLDDVRHDSV